MKYGYIRVSTKGQAKNGNSLEAQEKALKEAGAQDIRCDIFTGKTVTRIELQRILNELQAGDTLIVTKLDRFARTLVEGVSLVNQLVESGVTVNILNLGVLDNTPASKLIRNIFLAFSEFERDMIIERTQEGKEIARQKPGYREGRPHKYSPEKIDLAIKLLENNSYKQVEAMTGISKSTLQRAKRRKENKHE